MKPEDDIRFEKEDVDILNEVLDIVPELKICALAVKLRREKQVDFPIADHATLFDLFEGEELRVANHHINRKMIERYVSEAIFPIQDDDSLARAVYLALNACNAELNWALQAPPHAEELIEQARRACSHFTKIGGC